MMVGVIEVCCLQPLNYAKNMVQQNKPLTFHPTKFYRGLGANCINMGSCTMIQFSFGGAAKKYIQLDPNIKLKPHQEMECGISAGIISAIIGSPLELIMIQQQNNGGNTIDTIKNIVRVPFNIGRGYIGAAIREGLWTCGYLSVPPIIRYELTYSFPDKFDSQAKARIPASLLGGFFACYLTQPFDVIKTCMQGDINRMKYHGFIDTGKKLYKERILGEAVNISWPDPKSGSEEPCFTEVCTGFLAPDDSVWAFCLVSSFCWPPGSFCVAPLTWGVYSGPWQCTHLPSLQCLS